MLSPVQALLRRHDIPYPYECTFGLALLAIDKGVFCPIFTNASPLLLRAIDFRSREHVLDAFAGSGAFGINAALHGASVVAFDNSKSAIDCARSNAARNNVAELIEARVGTIKEAIALDEKFDLIIANPPLLPGSPKGELEAAVYDPGLRATIEFVEVLPDHLAKNGRCYLLTSDVFDQYGHDLDKLCQKNHLTMEIVSQANFGYETYRVHRMKLI